MSQEEKPAAPLTSVQMMAMGITQEIGMAKSLRLAHALLDLAANVQLLPSAPEETKKQVERMRTIAMTAEMHLRKIYEETPASRLYLPKSGLIT